VLGIQKNAPKSKLEIINILNIRKERLKEVQHDIGFINLFKTISKLIPPNNKKNNGQ
jgi:hypothetical protein